jgi:hypothetical protein
VCHPIRGGVEVGDGYDAAPLGAPRDQQEKIMTTLAHSTKPRLSTRNKVGFVIAFILGAGDIPQVFTGIDTGSKDGPPTGILAIDCLCGVVTVVAVVWAWRKLNRKATRIAAAARIVSVVTSLPAFFVDVPAGIKILVTASVILTVLAVTLMLTPPRERLVVTD